MDKKIRVSRVKLAASPESRSTASPQPGTKIRRAAPKGNWVDPLRGNWVKPLGGNWSDPPSPLL